MELFIFSWGTLICTIILLQNSSTFSTEQMTIMNNSSVTSFWDNTAITTYHNASDISTLVSDHVIFNSTSSSLMPSTIIRTVSSTTIATVSGQPDPTQTPKTGTNLFLSKTGTNLILSVEILLNLCVNRLHIIIYSISIEGTYTVHCHCCVNSQWNQCKKTVACLSTLLELETRH